MKYKIGDKVKIIRKINGHHFCIGEIGEISDTDTFASILKYLVKGKRSTWWMSEDEVEPYVLCDTFDEDFNAYEDKPPTKAEMHRRICEELTKTYVKKNTDYGDSYGQLRARYPDSILIRVFDKFSRLERLLKGNKALVEDESIEDTLLDLSNYCILELMERRIEKNNSGN